MFGVRCGLLAKRQTYGEHEKRRDLIGRERLERAIANVQALKRICVLYRDLDPVTQQFCEARCA
jgi:hypothetical protein